MTVNGLDIYYTSKIVGQGLKPISKKTTPGLKPISKTYSVLKPIKGSSCKKNWEWVNNIEINLIFINKI